MIIYKKIRPNPFLISGKASKTGQYHAAFVLTGIQVPISLAADSLSGKIVALLRYSLWIRLTVGWWPEQFTTVFIKTTLNDDLTFLNMEEGTTRFLSKPA